MMAFERLDLRDIKKENVKDEIKTQLKGKKKGQLKQADLNYLVLKLAEMHGIEIPD